MTDLLWTARGRAFVRAATVVGLLLAVVVGYAVLVGCAWVAVYHRVWVPRLAIAVPTACLLLWFAPNVWRAFTAWLASRRAGKDEPARSTTALHIDLDRVVMGQVFAEHPDRPFAILGRDRTTNRVVVVHMDVEQLGRVAKNLRAHGWIKP